MKDKQNFAKLLNEMFVIFGQEPSEERILLYWKYLHDHMTDEQFERVFRSLIEGETYFPSLSKFFSTYRKLFMVAI